MKKQADILTQYAEIDEAHVDALLQEELRRNRKKLVVLDDDSTGVQTVHDVSVYTHWMPEDLAAGFQEEENLFYVLTNSRGFTEAETIKAHREIAEATDKAAKAAGKEYLFVSRSDSTLRGHFPLETEILREEYEKNTGLPVDGEILCPFFKEGGRFTLDNIHYVKYGEELVPANETEFAKDPTFGYVSKTLPEYVEEKTGGIPGAGAGRHFRKTASDPGGYGAEGNRQRRNHRGGFPHGQNHPAAEPAPGAGGHCVY